MPRRGVLGTALANQRRMIAVGHETDFDAVRLIGNAKTRLARQGAHFVFAMAANGKQQMRQHFAAQAVQHIRLILVRIGGAVQLDTGSGPNDLGVVARGDEIGLQLLAVAPQLAELQPVVAHYARIGRAPQQIFVGEVIDDAIKLALKVEGIERDIEAVGDTTGVAGIDGAATAFLVVGAAILRSVDAGAHEQTDDLVALPAQQVRRHRAIDAAAHRQNDPCRHAAPSKHEKNTTENTEHREKRQKNRGRVRHSPTNSMSQILF